MSDIPIRVEVHPLTGDPFIIRNDRSTALTLVGIREPARTTRVTYAPTSDFEDGDIPLAVTRGLSALQFAVAARDAESESAAQAALAALDDIVLALSVAVHVVWHDHTQVWDCHAGRRTPASDREFADLRDHDPVWSVELPCQPVPTNP